ncbi:MAG: glycoside hydrolase family 127 protein, partial [Kiritimatiellaeota bacterium]|nr:glycoside hydrolase family 127 protein [Kiritimatiellota bacterium]
YDQSHLPVVQQYEALGHAVRAAYCYSAMTDIAMETGDPEYHSAVKSLWNNIVNAKYYITGGIGSGETSEGFGKDFSLPNNAYSESCSDCGELFFQHRMNLAYHEARYADLLEETLYNAILGSVDLPAKNFTYTNPLDQGYARYGWHGCPCCVGNIPRTLLMLPTWMYAKSADSLYVNLFIGSTVNVGPVAGTDVQIVQRTDYPWKGNVELIVKPAETKKFALWWRIPNLNVSALYHAAPNRSELSDILVNGAAVKLDVGKGYAGITREWKAGDTVSFNVQLDVARVKADERIVADRGRVALRYGPIIYSIESIDQNVEGVLKPDAALAAQWEPNLLGGVVTLRGQFADGKPLLAIPNYARNNRGGHSIVWIKDADAGKSSSEK